MQLHLSEDYPPAGWVCTRCERDELVFTCDDDRFVLSATPATDFQAADHPLADGWEVRASQRSGDRTNDVLIARVRTRHAARTALWTAMRAITRVRHETPAAEWLPLTAILAESDSHSGRSMIGESEPSSESR